MKRNICKKPFDGNPSGFTRSERKGLPEPRRRVDHLEQGRESRWSRYQLINQMLSARRLDKNRRF